MTAGWYWDASGGFIPATPDTWNPQVAFLVFPRITSSPRIDRRAITRFAARSHPISTLPIADQVRELQTALSVNKSELARILRVSRPTVYDWLGGGQPNAGQHGEDSDAAAVGRGIGGFGGRSAVPAIRQVCG